MATVKKSKSGSKIPKAQGGRLLRKVADKIVSKESNRIVDKIVKRPAGMTDKPVNYGNVVLTDAQKAKNAEILNRSKTTYVDKLRQEKIAQAEKATARNQAAFQAKLDAVKKTKSVSATDNSMFKPANRIRKKPLTESQRVGPYHDQAAARKKKEWEMGRRKTKPTPGRLAAAERHHKRIQDYNKANNTDIYWWSGAHEIDDIEKLKAVPKKKMGGVIKKAKDGMWMQKAAASIKRRGTAGKCTPITKPGCTGRAKALAKTFKKIAKSNKKK
jgi:hypothetical protein